MRIIYISLLACLSWHGPVLAQAGSGYAVVELFTSEGCSSCPPADRLVTSVIKEYAGQNVFVLAYHVDYWNRLGWKDPYSDHAWSARQEHYAELLGLSTVYTPQVIVNGRTEFTGSDSYKLHNAITKGLTAINTTSISLQASAIQDGSVNISYSIRGDLTNKKLLLALVQKNASTNVKAGENAGALLKHVNVVRVLQTIALNGKSRGSATLKSPVSPSVTNYMVIGFLQGPDGTITAVAAQEHL